MFRRRLFNWFLNLFFFIFFLILLSDLLIPLLLLLLINHLILEITSILLLLPNQHPAIILMINPLIDLFFLLLSLLLDLVLKSLYVSRLFDLSL